MDNDKSELRWGVAQRLEFIEFRLFWEGHENRSDLMEQFGLSVNQASADLNRYIGFVPDNMVYDKSARTYVDKNNLLISDLFYLEVRLGKWGNKMVHEMDFASVEEFTPYNNRYLLFSLLFLHK